MFSSFSLINNGLTLATQTANEVLLPMRQEFVHEDKSLYLSKEQRAHYVAQFENGRLLDTSGHPLSNKYLLYVLSPGNVLYVAEEKIIRNHSFFLAGGAVKAAGFIETNFDGTISLISNESGHYTPNLMQMLPALQFFYANISRGVKTPEKVIYESHDEAVSKEIISNFHLEQIINHIPYCTDPKSFYKLAYETMRKTSRPAVPVELPVDLGYEDKLEENNPPLQDFNKSKLNRANLTLFSRYGAKPKVMTDITNQLKEPVARGAQLI